MFYNSRMAITYRQSCFSHKMNSLKKALACLSALAVIFISFSCRNASDGGSDSDSESDRNLDLESYIFLRHRFAEENAEISYEASDADKLAWSKQHFADARDYMIEKVADFKHKVRDLEPEGNFLQPICDEIWTGVHGNDFHGYENGGSGIDPILNRNDIDYSKFLGAIGAKLDVSNNMDYLEYEKFEAHYAALALRAYNDSLGTLHHSERFQLNKERGAINNALIGAVYADYAASDHDNVEKGLKKMLENVSRETGVSVDTLIDAVNLNLLNVGMYGARDLGATAGVQLSSADKLLRPQLRNLTYKDLVHNVGIYEMSYRVKYRDEQQQTQEQGNSL